MKSESDLASVVGLLTVIAEQCGEQVSPQRLAFVAGEILKHGADSCQRALLEMMRSARRFPTVAEVEKAMGVTKDSEETARLLVAAIFAGIRKFSQVLPGNPTKTRKIQATIGNAAWDLTLACGGWNAVVDRLSREDEATVSAQIRELAIAMMSKESCVFLDMPPKPEDAKMACDRIDAEARRALEPANTEPRTPVDADKVRRTIRQMQHNLRTIGKVEQ